MRVKINSIILSVMCLLLLATPYIAQRINNIMKMGLEIILATILVMLACIRYKSIKRLIPVVAYLCVMIVSTYLSHGVGSRVVNAAITGGAYVLFYFLIEAISEQHSCEYTIRVVRNNLLLYMLIMDFFVVLTKGKGLGGDLEEAVYLLGNKFVLSYLHMAVLALIYEGDKKNAEYVKTLRGGAFFLYSIIILHIADTTTGMVGCAFVMLLLFLFQYWNKMLNLLSKPIIPIVFFLGSNAVFLLTDAVLNNSFLKGFFLARSHTSTILSGRVAMYEIAMDAIVQNPIMGYGLNYDIVEATLSFGNAQNGMLKSLLDFGIIGTVAFVLVLYMTFKNAENSNSPFKAGCTAFVYGMLFCSLVEINLSAIFMLVCACINAMGNGTIGRKRLFEEVSLYENIYLTVKDEK